MYRVASNCGFSMSLLMSFVDFGEFVVIEVTTGKKVLMSFDVFLQKCRHVRHCRVPGASEEKP